MGQPHPSSSNAVASLPRCWMTKPDPSTPHRRDPPAPARDLPDPPPQGHLRATRGSRIGWVGFPVWRGPDQVGGMDQPRGRPAPPDRIAPTAWVIPPTPQRSRGRRGPGLPSPVRRVGPRSGAIGVPTAKPLSCHPFQTQDSPALEEIHGTALTPNVRGPSVGSPLLSRSDVPLAAPEPSGHVRHTHQAQPTHPAQHRSSTPTSAASARARECAREPARRCRARTGRTASARPQ